jgi:hypothetical protein
VDGGGIDGGTGTYFATAGEDVHAVGTLAPARPGYIGCIVLRPDGSRVLARVVPDPLTAVKAPLTPTRRNEPSSNRSRPGAAG